MKTFEAKTTINTPTQTFDYVSDFTKHGEWAGRQPHRFQGHDASSLGPSPSPRFLNQIGRGKHE